MRKYIPALSILASALALATNPVNACTDITLTAKDGSQIVARTLEFAMPMNSSIVSNPRGTAYAPTAPDGKPAMSWKAKYGYLFVNAFDQSFTVDGMNDQGLAFEYLYLPGFTTYQTVPAGKDAQAIPYYNFGDWVLGNFKSVDEVRQALTSIYVYEQSLPIAGGMIFPLHAAIHDASGKGIVVEFVNGNMNVHDYVGVMTNSPPYDWQVLNLPQFFNLSPYNPKPIIVSGVAYGVNGQGAGMLGLPGDISPPSRFVKMAFMLQYSYQTDTALKAINLAEHIINNVDIPAGIAREKTNDTDSYETTQWTVFKDLTHKIFYYHSYDDLTLRSIDMNQLDLTEKGQRLSIPISNPPTIMDVTAKYKLSLAKPAAPAAAAPAPAAAQPQAKAAN
ncbi:MAG TPA: choloylglycine hydrolase family protein [Gammaproteobacteria bacterium]|nr:choloylglycine hydrolase family protein [Gammaproteobacteria bacterium]